MLVAHPVAELRRYVLQPGAFATLCDVFERHFVESQEATGMRVGGIFADEDDPDAFVWWRSFADHQSRARSLEAFYGGPVWAEHADVANRTMVAFDDVALLRPTDPPHPAPDPTDRRVHGDPAPDHRIAIGLHVVEEPGGGGSAEADATGRWFATEAHEAIERRMGVPVATWRTDPTPNGFPRLPVRPDRVLVWAATFPDAASRDDAVAGWATSAIGIRMSERTTGSRVARLAPTPRSAHPRPA